MPSFATSTVVRDSAHGLNIALNVRCVLVAGAPSDTVYALKGRVPRDIDVILQSNLVLALSGSQNRTKISANNMRTSAMAQHLVKYFHANGEQLGLRVASDVFVDEEDGNTKLVLSSTRPILDRRKPFLRLCAIELSYVCKAPGRSPQSYALGHGVEDTSEAADPFSPHAFLPVVTALDRIVDRFAIHLVRTYPLIFGPWRERFDGECHLSLKIAHAITEIIDRSPQSLFRKNCHRLIKTMAKNISRASKAASDSLLESLPAPAREDMEDGLDDDAPLASSEHYSILYQAMERMLKTSRRPLRYKSVVASADGSETRLPDDDFALSGDDLHHDGAPMQGLEGRDRLELWFGDETETPDGTQDGERGFCDDPNPDIWVSDGAESSRAGSPLEDFDDLWASSQSTLDDDDFWDLEGYSLSQSSTDGTPSDPSPRSEYPESLFADEKDDDGWLDDLALTPDQLKGLPRWPSDVGSVVSDGWSKHSQQQQRVRTADSPLLLATSDCLETSTHDLLSQAFRHSVDEALETVSPTSYLPLLLDDDLACDADDDGSGAPFAQLASPSPSPQFATIGEGSEVVLETEAQAPVQSSDRDAIYSRGASGTPGPTPHSALGNFHETPDVLDGTSLRNVACSVSSTGLSARGSRAIDGDGWDRQCQGRPDSDGHGWAHEGNEGNEGSLVADDLRHAAAIRSSRGEETFSKEGEGGGFLSELMFMDEDELEAGDMLVFE